MQTGVPELLSQLPERAIWEVGAGSESVMLEASITQRLERLVWGLGCGRTAVRWRKRLLKERRPRH